ncbi:MAG: prolyl oligopeptidase family serine peptidase [Bacteroidales bacterium]|nr:prolyl oligopeptidase family serine peptidase [Bacteroidales bacterium]
MKKNLQPLFYIGLLAVLVAMSSCNRPSANISLNPGTRWKFQTGNDPLWANPHTDDSLWDTISITNCWEEQGYPGYDGYGWYRKTVTFPEIFLDAVTYYKGLEISYQDADDSDALYFNGHYIGRTGNFPPNYKSAYGEKRAYVVPLEYIDTQGPNTIAIKVYDDGGDGGLITPSILLKPISTLPKIITKAEVTAENGVFKEWEPHRIELTVKNPEESKRKVKVRMVISTDDHRPVSEKTYRAALRPGAGMTWGDNIKLQGPGFYRCSLLITANRQELEPVAFNFGCEPEKIASACDAPEDLDVFWKETRALLDGVPMQPSIKLLPEHSRGQRNVYYVEMKSFGNETMGGYYAVPKKPGKHPVLITFMGYGSNPWIPHTDSDPHFITFVVSVRGQGIYKEGNTYESRWFTWGIESKETYYYRGAFMDLVRAVDFVCSRPQADTSRICAEGASQGGAFTLAVCALDDRIKVAAPAIPFLSDYPSYFQIAAWPASEMEAYLQAYPQINKEEIFRILAYFDIKNLAGHIKTPTIMAVGLQDEVCPPRTNFAGYNNISAPKDYRVYKDNAHSTPPEWQEVRMEFFKTHLNYPQP